MLAVTVSGQCSQMLSVFTVNFLFVVSSLPKKSPRRPRGWNFNLGARWGWVVKATPRPLYPRKRPGSNWVGPGLVWTGAENLASTGIRSPDLSARSDSLYRHSYPGQRLCYEYRRKIMIKKVGFMNCLGTLLFKKPATS
jgi:hypothetical protein